MKLDKATNIWSFTDLNNVIIDAHIYFKVYNGLQWIKGQHLVEVNLFSPECQVTKLELESFKGPSAFNAAEESSNPYIYKYQMGGPDNL